MLSIAVTCVSGYYHSIATSQKEGRNRLAALSIARTAMEHISHGHESLIPSTINQFAIEFSIGPLESNRFSAVQVIVSWKQNGGNMRSVTLDSGIYRENS